MERIGVEERRARLVRRHRLSAADRAASALEATRSLVVLHSTDAATVFLSLHARSDLAQSDIERELYEERTLVRMLGMRRTLFVVPRELVPVVEAAATRAIAARERRRLEQMIAESELSKQPGAWLTRAMDDCAARGRGPRRGVHVRPHEDRPRARRSASASDRADGRPRRAPARGSSRSSRWSDGSSAAGRARPGSTASTAGSRLRHGSARRSNRSIRRRPRRPCSSAGSPPSARRPRRTCAGGPAGRRGRRVRRSAPSRTPRSISTVPRATCSPTTSSQPSAPMPSAALLPTLDPTTMGWKEREWYLGPHERVLFDSVGNAGPTVWWDGRVVGGWSQRKRRRDRLPPARGRRGGRRHRDRGGGSAHGDVDRRRALLPELPPAVSARAERVALTPRRR